jgi:hypothetical protein
MDEGHVVITFGDFKLEATGSADVLRRTVVEFFLRLNASKKGRGLLITVGQKSVREILLDLRDNGFFDEPRDTMSCYLRLRELGKTGVTRNAVAMALKALVEEASLVRRGSGKTYVYISAEVAS